MRGNFNLEYDRGFKHERENLEKLKATILYVFNASAMEPTSGSIVDMKTGIDAYLTIQDNLYGVSIRVREKDYNSFTMNRHITDKHSEVHKWINPRKNRIKPSYHIQLAKRENGTLNVFRINIDVFSLFLKHLIKTNKLEDHWNSMLLAYEFTIEDLMLDGVLLDGIHNDIYSIR